MDIQSQAHGAQKTCLLFKLAHIAVWDLSACCVPSSTEDPEKTSHCIHKTWERCLLCALQQQCLVEIDKCYVQSVG